MVTGRGFRIKGRFICFVVVVGLFGRGASSAEGSTVLRTCSRGYKVSMPERI